jgi:predicted nucleic acid-binding protein
MEEHKGKIKALSVYTDDDLNRIIKLISGRIRFINIKLVPKESYKFAETITQDIDIDDTEFVALTEHMGGKLWSGDKELQKGLFLKGWDKFITTDELYKQSVKK